MSAFGGKADIARTCRQSANAPSGIWSLDSVFVQSNFSGNALELNPGAVEFVFGHHLDWASKMILQEQQRVRNQEPRQHA